MKTPFKYLSIFALSAALYGCGAASAPEDNTPLGTLLSERDSLKAEQEKIRLRLSELEDKIAVLDTTRTLLLVSAMQVAPDTFTHYFDVYGIVESDRNVTLYPETQGLVNRVLVREGARVSAGQALLQIDTEVLDRNIEQVESQYELAKTLFEKQQKLWDQKIGSEVQYLEARNNKVSLEANLASLREQRRNATVTAPFAGIVDEIFVKAGEMCAPTMPAVRMVNPGDAYIEADIPESYLGQVTAGTPVEVWVESLNLKLMSEVSQVGNYINPDNRTFQIRMELPENAENLKPNLLTRLRILDYQADSAMVVPNRLVQQTSTGDSFVYVLVPNADGETGRVEKAAIKPGKSYNRQTQILAGIQPGQKLVDKGARSVQDGQIVRIAQNTL